ncbi:MAG: radical SAM/SPASM domain-containing protein [Lachnospiraceae bacterium]|nr:radical SAM/SPASM domain-containing protein [Lachnospiraceae bacterium]
MIHQYKNNGYNIVLDVNSGAIHVVDDVTYEVIALLDEGKSSDEICGELCARYPTQEIEESLDECAQLKEFGTLFTEDIYEKAIIDYKARPTVVKALCLHIAHDCNLACRYCFAEEGEYHGRRALMSFEVGKKALDFLIANSGSRRNLEVDFFGGEPLMNWQVVKDLVRYGREQEKIHNKNFRFTMTTNGVLLNEEIMEFLNQEMANVVLSIDGRKEVHDYMRPFRNGKGSHDLILPKFKHFVELRMQANAEAACAEGGQSASEKEGEMSAHSDTQRASSNSDSQQRTSSADRNAVQRDEAPDPLAFSGDPHRAGASMASKTWYARGTFTHNNLDFCNDVLHLADEGFRQISVEPVVAEPSEDYAIGPEDLPKIFSVYDRLSSEMINREKEVHVCTFFHFMIDLTGGPCVYKRLSGCGSGTEYLAVTPWGDLYPCHQFVGHEEYLMGNVDEGVTRPDIVDQFKSCNVYTKEKCRNCFAKFYCSGGCAANSYNFHGTIQDTYDLGCEMQRKRVECAIMIKAALADA